MVRYVTREWRKRKKREMEEKERRRRKEEIGTPVTSN